MIDLIFAPENLPFSVALGLMLAIAVLEGVGMLFGAGLSGALESVAPDFDIDVDADIDADAGADLPALSQFLGWLRVGEVPILILLIVFLTSFGLGGLIVQGLVHTSMGTYLSMPFASLAAFGLALPSVRVFGGLLALGLVRLATRRRPGT